MGGIILRLGVRLEDRGERLGWGWLIRLGLGIREVGLDYAKSK